MPLVHSIEELRVAHWINRIEFSQSEIVCDQHQYLVAIFFSFLNGKPSDFGINGRIHGHINSQVDNMENRWHNRYSEQRELHSMQRLRRK